MGKKLGIEGFDLKADDEMSESSRVEALEAQQEANGFSEDYNTTASQKAGQRETFDELEQRTEQSAARLNTDPALTEE